MSEAMTFAVEATKYHPRGNRVLVRVDDPITQTPSGLYVPETSQRAPRTGTVLAAGPGYFLPSGKFVDLTLAEGSRVVFAQYAGTAIEDDDSLVILSADDVIATIEE